MTPLRNAVTLFPAGASRRHFAQLTRVFPRSHFERLLQDGFPFYRTTFWYPLDRPPENIFESVIDGLRDRASPSANVIGVEWWFSVLMINATPQWLLPCHFDRNDLGEKDAKKLKHPERSSVLFLHPVPYGDLVVTDQVLTPTGHRPRQPTAMAFVRPERNLYAVFPGHLRHGVIGRMWRPLAKERVRVSMAVNWWTEKPKAPYLGDSCECLRRFRLTAVTPA